MLFDDVEFAGGRIGATWLVGDGVAGDVLGGEGYCPPQVRAVLADPGFDEVATVIVLCHADLIPGDGDLIPVPAGAHILWGTVHVGTDRLQIGDDIAHSVEIAYHINDRVRDPAPVVELVKLDVQPLGVWEATTHGASIAGV